MQTNNLKRKTANQKRKLIGRGGKRGKTSGRGTKGQWAHGGHGVRPEMRDIIKKFPKLRGHGKNRARTVNDSVVKSTVLKLADLENNFNSGDTVSVKILVQKGLARKVSGKNPEIKILAVGNLSKKLRLVGLKISATAKSEIEKAGGSVK